jgi:DNA-binding phage protein
MSESRQPRQLRTTPFDAAEYLDDEQTIVAYLNEVLAEDDPSAVIAALGYRFNVSTVPQRRARSVGVGG